MITTLTALLIALSMQSPSELPVDRPCKYEDSTNCVWDAKHMGNGGGRSFVATGPRFNPTITFVSHRLAHRMLND